MWREGKKATHELRRTRERKKKKEEEERREEGRRRVASFFWCVHVALDSGWSEARADRFGLRSQLPPTHICTYVGSLKFIDATAWHVVLLILSEHTPALVA